MEHYSCLTAKQIEYYCKQMINHGVPCRFMFDGRNLNIVDGFLIKKGINVMYQMVYWHFSKETAKEIAKELDCQVIFSE